MASGYEIPIDLLENSIDASMESMEEGQPGNREVEFIAEIQFELKDLRGRLKRRNLVIDAIRKAYLRDVVTVKVRCPNPNRSILPDHT